jgi:septum site-determining protein MinC
VSAAAPVQKKSIRFRARSFMAFALVPEEPLADWLGGIDKWLHNSPSFFTGRPVVLSLTGLPFAVPQIEELVAQLMGRGIRVFAIEGDGLELGPTLPPLLRGARSASIEETQAAPHSEAVAEPPPPRTAEALIVDSPIRSGQSVFHPQGDVVVLGSVASGSEVMAGGSVHIYGALRGRAFAGALGNDNARIFCRKNEAELLAINGWYRAPDDMESASRGKPIQAFLKDGRISVVVLD